MGKRRLSDEPRCEKRQETSYKVTRGNSALSIVTMPQGNETLDTATMPPGNETLDTVTMPPGNETLDTATMPPGNETLDTVTMARKEREKNGPWEAELSYGGEVDLHKHLTGCEKNPGHVDFIPVDHFNVEHLPPGYQDNDLVELVKALSDLTVRVSVNCVSDQRPETCEVFGTVKPYPCYKNRGSNLVRVGSGWVNHVEKFDFPCDCKECLRSEKPETNFAHIEIVTAGHVVFDELEGRDTTCHLFFDRGGQPDACSSVVTLSGMASVICSPHIDWCQMTYVTHDLDIIDKLYNMVVRLNTLSLRNRRNSINRRSEIARLHKDCNISEEGPVIIVSHPHGCSKQVSVGPRYTELKISEFRFRNSVKESVKDFRVYYTSTCYGSSGARVLCLDDINIIYDGIHGLYPNKMPNTKCRIEYRQRPHSGNFLTVNCKRKEINYTMHTTNTEKFVPNLCQLYFFDLIEDSIGRLLLRSVYYKFPELFHILHNTSPSLC